MRSACFAGKVDEVQRVLLNLSTGDRHLAVCELDWPDGFTALHMAAMHGSVEVINMLLQCRAAVRLTNMRPGDSA